MVQDPTLTEDEHLVLRLHPHWKTLIGPLLVAVLVVAVALIAEVLIPSNSAAVVERLVVAAVAILAVMLWLIVPVLRWRTTTYELTTRRMRVRSGIVTRHGRDIPLARINDVSFAKGLLDRLLGSGRLVVESAGEHGQILLNDIPHVESVQTTLFRLVEGRRGRVPMRMDVIFRFDYGRIVPWVRRRDYGLSAIAGPDAIQFRSRVRMRGEDCEVRAEPVPGSAERVR